MMSDRSSAPDGAARRTATSAPMLADTRTTKIVVTCGSGGVGKTTTAAAMALWAADAGRKVAVLTIDPAKRLAQSLGLRSWTTTRAGWTSTLAEPGGELWAMMLDTRRTFDEMVASHSTPERAAAILANPFYKVISTSFSGTQEYMAMEKLSQPGGDGPVRPDRRRHPAEPIGAGLPGRAAAAVLVHGRPDDQAAGHPRAAA